MLQDIMEQLKKGLLVLGWVFLDFKIWAHMKVTEIPSEHNRCWGETVGRRWHRVPNKTQAGKLRDGLLFPLLSGHC